MCGIAGLIADGAVEPASLEAAMARMLAAMRQRGPDDSGHAAIRARDGATILLGNTRLAILDPSANGHQPMHDPRTGNCVVLNGELYDHLEVRRALPDEPWRSGTDTETLLRAHGRWGPSCLDRLRGMFAAAIWSEEEQAVWVARDPLGIKPLYLWRGDGVTAFASEVRALLASGLVPARLDRRGLSGYVRFGCVPEPWTLIRGVTSLPAGTWTRLAPGRASDPVRYWSLPRPVRPTTSLDDAELREELGRAVREHLLSDVPVAAFLSGGLDSSAVVALAASAAPVHAFTVGFHDAALDESDAAAELARRHGVPHTIVRLDDAEVLRAVPRGVDAMDLPTIDGLNTYIVSQAVAEAGFKVVLSGLGGDELFGGYPQFRRLAALERLRPALDRVPRALRRLLVAGGARARRLDDVLGPVGRRARYDALRALWSTADVLRFGLDEPPGLSLEEVDDAVPAPVAVSVHELAGYTRSMLLRDSDALSMAHSLELRVPLLDTRLVERALSAHASVARRPKARLARAVEPLLPPGMTARPKQGFALPMAAWLRGPLAPYLQEGLERLASTGAVRAGGVLDAFAAGRVSWSRPWAFAVLGHWLTKHQVEVDAA